MVHTDSVLTFANQMKHLEKDAYPFPRTDYLLDELGGNKRFSTLDLASGYWQVGIYAIDKKKTAFTLQGKVLFYFT